MEVVAILLLALFQVQKYQLKQLLVLELIQTLFSNLALSRKVKDEALEMVEVLALPLKFEDLDEKGWIQELMKDSHQLEGLQE